MNKMNWTLIAILVWIAAVTIWGFVGIIYTAMQQYPRQEPQPPQVIISISEEEAEAARKIQRKIQTEEYARELRAKRYN